jgi:hypothetical protein
MSKRYFEEFRMVCMNRELKLGYSEKWNVKPTPENSEEMIIQNTYLNST